MHAIIIGFISYSLVCGIKSWSHLSSLRYCAAMYRSLFSGDTFHFNTCVNKKTQTPLFFSPCTDVMDPLADISPNNKHDSAVVSLITAWNDIRWSSQQEGRMGGGSFHRLRASRIKASSNWKKLNIYDHKKTPFCVWELERDNLIFILLSLINNPHSI